MAVVRIWRDHNKELGIQVKLSTLTDMDALYHDDRIFLEY